MAVENRGGPNGGRQYNPNMISPMGGNGQSGNKAAKMASKAQELRPTGFGYGQNTAMSQTIQAGGNVVGTAPAAANKGRVKAMPRGASLRQSTPVTAPTELPEESILAGTPLPGGAGPEALMLPAQPQGDKGFNNSIQAYAQPLEYIVSQPNTSQETRDVIALLLRQTAE
jgi:hypothetical protein